MLITIQPSKASSKYGRFVTIERLGNGYSLHYTNDPEGRSLYRGVSAGSGLSIGHASRIFNRLCEVA